MNSLFILAPIVVPFIGGLSLLFLKVRDDRVREIYSEIIVVLTSVCVWLVLVYGSRDPVHIYSFTDGFSINFRVDGPAMLFAGMISVLWPFVMLYAFEYMKEAQHRRSFFAFYVMTYGVTLGIAFAADLVTMYVFFEMLTLVTLPLVVHYQNHESMFAGRMYVAYCIGGASLGFIAVVMGTLDGGGLFIYGGNLGGVFSPSIMRIMFLFGFFGFGTKAAIFPLSRWLPQASVAPTPVTALLHAVAVVNSGVYAVIRLAFYAYGPELMLGSTEQIVCAGAAVFTIVFGAGMALRERHFKRRLAWSTVSNLSYMLFGILLMTPEGLLGGLAHMLFHSVIKMVLFLCAGAFMHVTGKEYIYEVNGVGRKMPLTFALYTLSALSLTGIPLFCGFISKWKLLEAGFSSGQAVGIAGAAALILSAFLCAMYTLNISIRAFFPMRGRDRSSDLEIGDAGVRMLIPICVFSVVNILFGVWSGPVIAFLEKIAQGLI